MFDVLPRNVPKTSEYFQFDNHSDKKTVHLHVQNIPMTSSAFGLFVRIGLVFALLMVSGAAQVGAAAGPLSPTSPLIGQRQSLSERAAKASRVPWNSGGEVHRALGGAVDEAEVAEIEAIYEKARQGYAAEIAKGSESGKGLRLVQFTLYSDLEELVTRRPDSSFAPSLHNAVALGAAVRGSYLKSIQHYTQSWDRAKLFDEPAAKGMADTAAQMLSRSVVLPAPNHGTCQENPTAGPMLL